ncbi:hypothetical protein SELMODRAFT_419576 [Selaginella moellendorffii]|uniref:Uncharacterized protein n=1 Tax=Selaginella moellendorffii TaxID=88036 RepID=D8S9D9_SELML|nr:hypothetical protein SELMODRAFT_419576 [Selaginella moellendorffii]
MEQARTPPYHMRFRFHDKPHRTFKVTKFQPPLVKRTMLKVANSFSDCDLVLLDVGCDKNSYPFCWQSETPLIYKALPSWKNIFIIGLTMLEIGGFQKGIGGTVIRFLTVGLKVAHAYIHYPFENRNLFDKTFLLLLKALIKLVDDGKKMSKKLKNYPPPIDVVHDYGAVIDVFLPWYNALDR